MTVLALPCYLRAIEMGEQKGQRLTRRAFLKGLGLAAGTILLRPRFLWAEVAGGTVEGIVFHDRNEDGLYGGSDEGVAGVLVSDGTNVVQTDSFGQFVLELGNERGIIFITTPSGWQAERFYQHLGPEMGRLEFPLRSRPVPESFNFIQVTDIHITRQAVPAVEEFVARANELAPDFLISTGDLVMDVCYFTNLSDTLEEVDGVFDIYREAMAGLGSPLLEVIGNHDCACALPQELPEYYKGEYQKIFGPLWYSFDYGGWHFIVLDGNAPEPPPHNWLNEEELEWLRRDLSFQSRDRPILLFSHQPLFFCRNYEKLLRIVEGYNIMAALAGHEHATYTRLAGLTHIVTGALSGRWWADDGLHWNGHNTDGSPQGFRICQIEGERFSSEYLVMKG